MSAEEPGEAPVFDIALEALPGEEEAAGVDGAHLWIDLGDLAGPTRPSGAVAADDDEWARAGREIRSLVDGQVGRDDYETRYDLGIAYREMGLLDLDGPNDGTVAVEETRLEGATAHCTLPVTHTGMWLSPQTAEQVATFLQHGRFNPTG